MMEFCGSLPDVRVDRHRRLRELEILDVGHEAAEIGGRVDPHRRFAVDELRRESPRRPP
jgi:hypothetical protein